MSATDYKMPAEFDDQSAVYLGWPKMQWYSVASLDTRLPIAEIIVAVAKQIETRILCADAAGESAVKAWFSDSGH